MSKFKLVTLSVDIISLMLKLFELVFEVELRVISNDQNITLMTNSQITILLIEQTQFKLRNYLLTLENTN